MTIYLTGSTNAEIEARLIELGVGLMIQPRSGYRPERIGRYPYFAADNGCYAQGERFDADRWLGWLGKLRPHRATCLFAVAPDVVGDAAATIERSRPFLARIRELGFPAAFVAQDGQEDLPVPWDQFDCLFVGGTTEWKLSEPAYGLVREAKRRGRWTHQGRVNGWRRFRACLIAGFDSCDGTYIAYAPNELLERVTFWMEQSRRQPALPLFSAYECGEMVERRTARVERNS